MYVQKKTIFLKETDATGALYFSALLEFGAEAFENYLRTKNFPLQRMIQEEEFTFPIVHAEADYLLPLFVGDEVTVELSVEKIGTSSVALSTSILKEGKEAGKAKIIHVCVSKGSKRSIPIPPQLLAHLREL